MNKGNKIESRNRGKEGKIRGFIGEVGIGSYHLLASPCSAEEKRLLSRRATEGKGKAYIDTKPPVRVRHHRLVLNRGIRENKELNMGKIYGSHRTYCIAW